jgi:hypothetical protein
MSDAPTTAASNSRERVSPLKAAVRQARIEAAERTGVVVDLRDAEIARLEILNEALDPIFADVPAEVELFDRGLSPGDPPRLWIDMIAHVAMGPDKRLYRFAQDTRYGRRVLLESPQVDDVVTAVTHYIARRLVERERALASVATPGAAAPLRAMPRRADPPRPRLAHFLLGAICGAAALFAAASLWPAIGH